MKAQIVMLKEALKDPTNEKFIFLSESAIPFCDFETTYNFMTSTNKSIFPFSYNVHADKNRAGTFWHYHNYQPKKDFHPIPRHLQYKTLNGLF